jgi:hypothetical protein
MADPNLTESAWQRAKVDAAGVYRTTTFQLGGALVTAIFSALTLIAQEGQPTTTQVAVPILAAAVAILLSVVVVLVCQLAAAPVRQRNELRSAWSVPKIETVNVDLTLRNAHLKGSDLAARFKRQTGFYSKDTKRVEDWTEEVVHLLAGNVPDEDARKFIEASKQTQHRLADRLQARLNALRAIIDGLSEG